MSEVGFGADRDRDDDEGNEGVDEFGGKSGMSILVVYDSCQVMGRWTAAVEDGSN